MEASIKPKQRDLMLFMSPKLIEMEIIYVIEN